MLRNVFALKGRKRLAAALCSAGLLTLAATASGAPLNVGSDATVVATDFRSTIFATALPYPTSMQLLPDGSLLVLINRPIGGSLYQSSAELVRLVDADGDGVADGPGTALITGLPGVATSVRLAGTLIFVSNQAAGNEHISVLRAGATPDAALTLLGSIDFYFPFGFHRNVALAVRNAPGQSGTYDVFFNVGAAANFAATTTPFAAAGLLAGVPGATSMSADSIYKVTVHDGGAVPVLSDLLQVAAGLRNAAGIAFHPTTGDLYFNDNGIDGINGNPDEPLSADELNRITAAGIGGAIEDFGYPGDYVTYRTGAIVGGSAVHPVAAFQPIPDPMSGSESEGAVEIAFAPPNFPPGLRNGVFVGFHGRFALAGIANEENPVVFFDLDSGQYLDFVSNDEPGVGHPNALLTTADSLFIADLTSSGSTLTTLASGVIYQIRAVPGLHLRGTVRYAGSALPVSGVTLRLSGAASSAGQTGTTGHFAFAGLSAGAWTLQASKSATADAAVTAADAVVALHAAVGDATLSDIRQRACDVNGDGRFSAIDALLILKYSTGEITHFPAALQCGSDWTFVPTAATAGNEALIASSLMSAPCDNPQLSGSALASDALDQDLTGALFGDCTLSWQP